MRLDKVTSEWTEKDSKKKQESLSNIFFLYFSKWNVTLSSYYWKKVWNVYTWFDVFNLHSLLNLVYLYFSECRTLLYSICTIHPVMSWVLKFNIMYLFLSMLCVTVDFMKCCYSSHSKYTVQDPNLK